MIKKISLVLLTTLAVIALFFAYRLGQSLTPESILKQLFDLNVPTRFAFISDQETKKLAVVDIEENQQVGLLNLQIPAKTMAIEKITGTLAYSDGGRNVILHNLTSHTERVINFSHPVEKIIFTSYSELVAIGKKEISIFHLTENTTTGKKLSINAKITHSSSCLDCPLSSDRLEQTTRTNPDQGNTFPQNADIVSAVFSPLDQSLFLLERSPSLKQINIENERLSRTFLPKSLHNLSSLAVSPDGDLLLFGAQKNRKNFAILFKAGTIEKTLPLSAPLVQPYIDQNGQYLIMIDQSGKGWIVDEKRSPIINQSAELFQPSTDFESGTVDVGMAVSGYATVFLNRKLLIIGEEIKLFQLPNLLLLDQKKLEKPVQSLFVHGNSKTVLLGSATEPLFYLYNSGDQSLQKITLNGVQSASVIIMGASNTICH